MESSNSCDADTSNFQAANGDTGIEMGYAWRAPSPAADAYRTSSVESSPSPGSAQALESSSNSSRDASDHFARPSTPPARYATDFLHGLPSPNTPDLSDTFSKNLLLYSGAGRSKEEIPTRAHEIGEIDELDAVDFDGEHGEEEVITSAKTTDSALSSPNDDEQLARELEESASPTTIRRSTRVRKQVTSYNLSPTPPVDVRKAAKAKSKPTITEPETESLVPFELTITPAKADPIPFEGLPLLRSLDWELRYPPGGSTHPSYPYPTLDPRLIFCQPFVPVVDGLPDFSKVPKLTLPMGWRQATWCGLLPVVFDPNRQAFKLTPVGPLPLTCEELQQGGLQDFVPGGDLHPEAGLLPEMMRLSDGSVDEVYNWDGVDWTLPWGKHEDFGRSLSTGIDAPQSVTSDDHTPKSAPAADVWACPDDIVDLEDAWRWMQENEQRSSPSFEPDPTKTWRGTGIYRVTRKHKQPIASLLAITLADKSETASKYLVNQNGREFCQFKSLATPVHINIALLRDVEITLFELLAYFPCHYQWRQYADRLVRSGLSASDVMNLINMMRQLEGDAVRSKSSINDNMHYGNETDAFGNRKKVRIERPGDEITTSFTADGWEYNVWELTDYPLLGLAHGLKRLPTGPDSGPITACIVWCRKNGRYMEMLSDVPELVKEIGIEPLIERGEGGCPDKEVSKRHAQALKEDRKRVLRKATELKRAAEAAEAAEIIAVGSKRKRVKLE